MNRLTISLVLVSTLLLTGCSWLQDDDLSDARKDFNGGSYDDAHETASRISERSSGPAQEEAAYLAGVAAYKMGDLNEAEAQLYNSIQSTDPVISGRSNATLGLIRLDQGRSRAAAELFKTAARQLEGSESAEAANQAGLAFQQAGDVDQAREQFRFAAAGGTTTSGGTKTGAATSKLFTVQAGAFRSRVNAETTATAIRAAARRGNLGVVRIVPRETSKGLLHIVQIGSFNTKYDAERAKRRLGSGDYIVAAVR